MPDLIGHLLQYFCCLSFHLLGAVVADAFDDAGVVKGGHDPKQSQGGVTTAVAIERQPIFKDLPVAPQSHFACTLDDRLCACLFYVAVIQ